MTRKTSVRLTDACRGPIYTAAVWSIIGQLARENLQDLSTGTMFSFGCNTNIPLRAVLSLPVSENELYRCRNAVFIYITIVSEILYCVLVF